MGSRYGAVIVTYNPDIETLVANVRNVSKQGFDVVVVDNSSGNVSDLDSLADIANVVRLDKNYGIAKALNVGMQYARKSGSEWVLSLDQDTKVCSDLLEVYERYTDLDRVGALCSTVKRKDGYSSFAQGEFEVVERCPTAGFFMKTEAWEKVGGYDEWMFIDYVDYDMCMRLRLAGYNIYRARDATVFQQLGNERIIKPIEVLGRTLGCKRLVSLSRTYNHSSTRNYYFVRNSLYYQHKYKGYIDVASERRFLMRWEVKKLLFERNRIKTTKSIIAAIIDYIRCVH